MLSDSVQLAQLVASAVGGLDERIVDAFRSAPREAFVPRWLAPRAYEDVALPIGNGQTISQPSMVALMLAQLDCQPASRVLEVGAGSGYAACLLSYLASEVHAVERHAELAQRARNTLSRVGRRNVSVYHGDGAVSFPQGRFDRVLVSAAAADLPSALVGLLPRGGRLVAPVGAGSQQVLLTVSRDERGQLHYRESVRCVFVPLISEGQPRHAPAA